MMAEGDVVQNVNPRPTGSPPPTKYVAPPKKPEGPVLEQRRLAAIMKAGMIVDARIYGVKPMALSKYINDMIKQAPYQASYNKAMMGYSKISSFYIKSLSVGLSGLAKEIIEFRKSYSPAAATANNLLRSITQQEKDAATKPTLTTKILGDMVKGDTEERRRKLYAEREAQKNAYDPNDDPVRNELEITNAELKKILDEGAETNKELKKKKGDMFGGLNKTWLAGAAVLAAGQIIKAIEVGLHGLKDSAEARRISSEIEKKSLEAGKALEKRLIEQGRSPEEAAAYTKASATITQVGSLRGKSSNFVMDALFGEKTGLVDMTSPVVLMNAVKLKYLTPWEAMTFNRGQVDQRLKDIEDKADKEAKELSNKFQGQRAGSIPASPMTTPTSFTLESKKITETAMNIPAGLNVNPKTREDVIKNVRLYDEKIEEASKKWGVDSNKVRAIIAQESKGIPFAESPTGVKGLAQFTKKTGKAYGIDPKDRTNVDTNINAAAHYLRDLLDTTGGDFPKALSLYNAGTTNLSALPPEKYKETSTYIKAVPKWLSDFEKERVVIPRSDNIYSSNIKNTQAGISSIESSVVESTAAQQQKQTVLLQGIYDYTKTASEKDLSINMTSNAPSSVLTQ